ncbi:MAG: SoxR reducing system RseC family protein [Clostridia bacterium]|nr:SoxR reducing system RseC family protein [Clostridia bacterium]
MRKIKKEKYNELIADNCEVLDLYKNKVVVKISKKEKLIAKKIGILKKGDKVKVYKKPALSKIEQIFIYISPVYYLILGFVFGFLFNNDLFHYLFILGATVLGFIQLFILKYFTEKAPSTVYVAIKN